VDFIVGGLVILAGLLLILFFAYQPDYPEKGALTVFNLTMLGITFFLSFLFFLWMKATYAQSQYEEWWFFMALCGSLIIIIFLVLLAMLARWWIFRVKSQNYFSGW
jgi:ABC-type nickel/cobalt efflux system permease component RcnA